MQDAVLPGQFCSGSLCSLFIGSTDVKNTVCLLLKICPHGINPEFMMECKLIPDCVLSDLEEFGDTKFLVLMDQYNIEIFSCFLRLLPLYPSTIHQTNAESSQDHFEGILIFSRIQSLHRLLEVGDMTKKSTQLF